MKPSSALEFNHATEWAMASITTLTADMRYMIYNTIRHTTMQCVTLHTSVYIHVYMYAVYI